MHQGIKWIVAKDKQEAARFAADIYEALLQQKPACVLGLATGSTPIPLYRELIARDKAGKLSFRDVRSVNLDEYRGLSPAHPQSYRYFMQEQLFDHVSIRPENTFVPDGLREDVAAACREYEERIESLGGIDLQLLGIGHDGHIGFNEPEDVFRRYTHEARLTDMTREANRRFFASLEEVPLSAVTMGIGTVMGAERILLMATGKDKHAIMGKAFKGPVTPWVPASILQFHHDVTVIVDEDCFRG